MRRFGRLLLGSDRKSRSKVFKRSTEPQEGPRTNLWDRWIDRAIYRQGIVQDLVAGIVALRSAKVARLSGRRAVAGF
jgi:hypothetical protein